MKIWHYVSGTFGPLARIFIGVLTAMTIIWWMHSLQNIAQEGPEFSALKELKLTLAPDSSAILGRAELLQPSGARSAELKHVRLRATDDGDLFISRVSQFRNLNVEFGGKTEEGSSDRYEISQKHNAVTKLHAGAQTVEILTRPDESIEIRVDHGPNGTVTSTIQGDGRNTLIDNVSAQNCYARGTLSKLASQANAFSQRGAVKLAGLLDQIGMGFLFKRMGHKTIAIIGGKTSCSMYSHALLAMPLVNPELEFILTKNLSDGRLFLSVYRKVSLVPISYETWVGNSKQTFHNGRIGMEVLVASIRQNRAASVTHFTAGRTRYSIDALMGDKGMWNIAIKPVQRIALFDARVCNSAFKGGGGSFNAEDCPMQLASSPNLLPEGAHLELIEEHKPTAFDRMFVSSRQGLSGAENLARGIAIGMSILIILAVPGVTIWRWNGSIFSAIFLASASIAIVGLALLPDLISIANIFTDVADASLYMFYAMGALWICATIIITFDRSGGHHLSLLWLVLTAIIALSSLSMFSMSLEGPNTDWERFFIKHKLVVLDILPVLAISLTIVSPTALKLRIGNDFAGRPSLFSPIFWLLTIVLTLFAAWFFLGSQTGLAGSIQPVEAGKFAVVVLLGSALAQWLIRARLLAQSWFGLTIIAVVLSAVFMVALLIVPAVKSDYSPLIIIASVSIITVIVGLTTIGYRIKEEEEDDINDIRLIPLSISPMLRDVRLHIFQFLLLLLLLAAAIYAPKGFASGQYPKFLTLVASDPVYMIAASLLSALALLSFARMMFISRAIFILILCAPFALIGAWALLRDEMVALSICVISLVVLSSAIAFSPRVNWALARIAIVAPIIAMILTFGLKDLPTKMGLGVQQWSWFDSRNEQIDELEKVLGTGGRRLPIERLMSWADLRYGRSGGASEARQLILRDENFHVLRSRATLAHAPCRLSPELTNAPFYIGETVGWFSRFISDQFGLGCEDEYIIQTAALGCTPATLRGPVRAHCVPVVQSDFAATYITARLGKSAAVLLLTLQGIFILLVVSIYIRLQARRSRDPVETGADQALACIALGVGALFLMQWILAWSNVFGLLPVMGQPMTWLSAGTSHHLFMAIPAALVLLVATRLAGMKTPVLTIRMPPRRSG